MLYIILKLIPHFTFANKLKQLNQVTDYYLNLYSLNIPKDTPSWIVDYLQYLHCFFPYSYTPNEKANLKIIFGEAEGEENLEQPAVIEVFKPLPGSNIPFLRIDNILMGLDFPYTWATYYLHSGSEVNQIHGYWPAGYDIFQDANGKPIAKYIDETTSGAWYSFHTTGVEFLFGNLLLIIKKDSFQHQIKL